MTQNRGKPFEKLIHDSFDKEDVFVLRLYDTMYMQAKNPCDFIVVVNKKPVFIECKSTHETSFNPHRKKSNTKSDSKNNQWECLLQASTYDLLAGYIIWFVNNDVTVFIRVQDFDKYLNEHDRKSISYKDAKEIGFEIKGTKKKVYYDYDMKEFIKYASEY